LPSEIDFNPIFHHLSRSSWLRSSTFETLLSGTGSMAAAGSPGKNQKSIPQHKQNKNHEHATIQFIYIWKNENLEIVMNIE